ncbi:MAG: hypothetical protein FJ087_22145 [Deltaproteobacteria bacterium]|nr:hypothetical protein [Deltaproteobacteria bacterium]
MTRIVTVPVLVLALACSEGVETGDATVTDAAQDAAQDAATEAAPDPAPDTAPPADLPPADLPPADPAPIDTTAPDAPPADAPPADAPPPDVQCAGPETHFPAFDKACAADGDCALVFHTTDCCGSEAALGIRADQVSAFGEAEATCDSQYPPCDCPSGLTIAEDGKTGSSPAAFGVACAAGKCTSFVKPGCPELAAAFFADVHDLAWCTGPDQCGRVQSPICVDHQGCGGVMVNEAADWTDANAILAKHTAQGCPAVDETCECPKPNDASFGCNEGRCVACEKACPQGCGCKRDGLGCPTGECEPEACPGIEAQIAAKVGETGACAANDGCILVEMGPICGSMSCRQTSIPADAPDAVKTALYDLGAQGMSAGCSGFHCGCGPLGVPLCIDQECRLCPPDCSGSCAGLLTAAKAFAEDARGCWTAGECAVPDVCTTCGIAVRKWAAEKEFKVLDAAVAQACGPLCTDTCPLPPQPYKAACVSGTCERLPFGGECEAIHAAFDAVAASSASLACATEADCAATTFTGSPFCTTECACATITNQATVHALKVLADEYALLGCPSEPCFCTKCMTQVQCLDGKCSP